MTLAHATCQDPSHAPKYNHKSYAVCAPMIDRTPCERWLYRSTNACAAFNRASRGMKELTVGHLTAKLAPEHLNRVQPGAGGGSVQEPQPPRGGANDGLALLLDRGVGVI